MMAPKHGYRAAHAVLTSSRVVAVNYDPVRKKKILNKWRNDLLETVFTTRSVAKGSALLG